MLSKRITALLLCLVMCVAMLAGCTGSTGDDDKGAYITMYLTDEIYNFDPVYAYTNEDAESIVSLLFARLFSLNESGKLQYDLAESYKINEDEKTKEYTMVINMRQTWWSDKTQVTADDVVYAWKRILNSENSFACASLLFDLKNARAVKAGNCSIDDLGVCALNDTTLQITFEKPIDYDAFLINLTSLALAPLREDYVSKGDDWAKKPGTMVTSGPFKIGKVVIPGKNDIAKDAPQYYDTHATQADGTLAAGANYAECKYDMLVLERNPCYLRNPSKKDLALDKSVTPYRILIDCTRSAEEIKAAYENGELMYLGKIPVSLRTDASLMKKAKLQDALSTQVLYLNENAQIAKKGSKETVALFAIPGVRQALSLAIDRSAIADQLVAADAATGLVPNGIFNKGTSGSFRKTGGDLISTSADLSAAKAALSAAGVTASDYAFSIKVNANDDALVLMAEAAAAAWNELGFEVTVVKRGTIRNNDYYAPTASVPEDICDETYLEDLRYQEYEVLALDYCAYTADAYSLLAPFATEFSGLVDVEFNTIPHYTGYSSQTYDDLIEAVYYLNYYHQISAENYASFVIYNSAEEFQTVLDRVKAVYDKYGIDTEKNLANGRATLLHEAEKLLMEEMPAIPVVFNKTATLSSGKISGVKTDRYTSYRLAKTKLKNYQDYLAEFEAIYAGNKE